MKSEFTYWVVRGKNGWPMHWTVSQRRKDAIAKMEGNDGRYVWGKLYSEGFRAVKCTLKFEER